MSDIADRWAIPTLTLLADWSLRWGVVLAALMIWFALRPPRRPALRHSLCLAALLAGISLLILPRWIDAPLRWPPPALRATATTARPVSPQTPRIAHPPEHDLAHIPTQPAAHGIVKTLAQAQAQPQTRALDTGQSLAISVALLWLAASILQIIRLIAGRMILGRLRHTATPLGDHASHLLEECRHALNVTRLVGLAQHPAIGSPVLLGGRRPLVLVPSGWESWPQAHRRACLTHELAHIARRDDWLKIVQEFVRVPMFFHPLVHWLLARLDRERELVCDEVVIAQGTSPNAYARMLLNLAQRPGRILSGSLPFLDRGTVASRTKRLLEDDMPHAQAPSPAQRRLAFAAAFAVIAGGIGGLQINAGENTRLLDQKASQDDQAAAAAAEKTAQRAIDGLILDPDGNPVANAIIVAGLEDTGTPNHQVLHTDQQGRFHWPIPAGTINPSLVAYKKGFAPFLWSTWISDDEAQPQRINARVSKPESFKATIIDAQDKPVAGALVRIEMSVRLSPPTDRGGGRTTQSVSYSYIRPDIITNSPLEHLFVTTTNDQGAFVFNDVPPGSSLRLDVSEASGRKLRVKSLNPTADQVLTDSGFVSGRAGESTQLVAYPAARVAGRVVSKVPGVNVPGVKIVYQASQIPGSRPAMDSNFGGEIPLDSDGRFTIDGLDDGTINIIVNDPDAGKRWTYRAAQDVVLKSGETADVTIEVIQGVDVEGKVVAKGTGKPVAGADVGVYGPNRPRTSAMTQAATTDASDRFHYRLPPGETYLYVMGPPSGFTRLPPERSGSSQTVTIPDNVSRYEVPPLELAPAVTVSGRLVDAVGSPIPGATIVGVCQGGLCTPFAGAVLTDTAGAFQLPEQPNNIVALGEPAQLLIRLPDGAEHEATAMPVNDGSVLVTLATVQKKPEGVEGPVQVASDELAGIVVDRAGNPIQDVEVDAWTWYSGNETKTDARGLFRLGNLGKDRRIEVMFRKPGYTPQLFVTQPTGSPGWVVVLGDKTYFEGKVIATDGKPVPGALVRANNGPKQADGVRITSIWTETQTDPEGRYRLYAQADVYDIQVRVPAVGVARLTNTSLGADEAKHLDIPLHEGVIFRAKLLDTGSGSPVSGAWLWYWQQPGIEGRSDSEGIVTIPVMLPGRFEFNVDAPGYTRWWSDQAFSEWNRRRIDPSRGGWQRNFDPIDFELSPGMEPVTITLERGVTITGRVLDPDGNPVAGATVAPALTGTGNSLTGDTRFSVSTDDEGKYTVILPASGEREYNLVAHDGKFQEWRAWANGILPPFRTRSGEEYHEKDIRLTRPATVRGRVTNAQGQPIAGREVRASASDRMENRYYDPTTSSSSDGTYELKFI
jgi:beta-lactamase regulating signal transducer with metallopeptidase domain/protocatechuate 3,4-dioxygenase beta subunit